MTQLASAFLFVSLLQASASAQVIIEEARLSMSLPNDSWSFIEREVHGSTIVYTYKREPIMDSAGRWIDPHISFLIEPVGPDADVVMYSFQKRSAVPFDVVSMFSHEDGTILFKNGIGYRGKYMDRGLEHRIYVVHGIHNEMGITLIMDTTEEIADIVAPEFLQSLATLDAVPR